MHWLDKMVLVIYPTIFSKHEKRKTLAAITGSIAEAACGIPDWIKDKAYSYLDELLKDVLRRWEKLLKTFEYI